MVARSSTEVEFRSMAASVDDLIWVQTFLTKLGIQIMQKPLLYCDNLSAVMLSHNPIMHACTKHMEIDLFFCLRKGY